MLRLSLAVALGLLVLVPSAEAGICRDFFAVNVGLEKAHLDLAIAYFGEDATIAREEIDRVVGNKDGHVSASEVSKYEDKYTFDGDTFTERCAKNFGFLTIDGELPVGLAQFEKIMLDAEGKVREDPLWYQIRLTLDYPANDREFGLVEADLGDFELFRAAFECAVPDMGTGWWGDHTCGTKAGDAIAKPKFYGMSAGWGYEILPETIAPHEVRRVWRGDELRGETIEEQSLLRMHVVSLKIAKGPSTFSPESMMLLGGAGAGFVALGAAAFVWSTDLRYPFSRWFLALPLFSRFDRDSAADHPRRQEVLAAVEASPGISLNELGRRTEIPKGALTHHLRVLERHGLLTSRRERIWTRFFPPNVVRRRVAIVTTRQEDVTQLLAREPGLSQTDLAARLGLQRKAAQYHLDRLEQAGIVRSDRSGRRTLYFLPEQTAAGTGPDRVPGAS